MRSILAATRNAHKTAEIAAILSGWRIADLSQQTGVEAPDETGATFGENAAIKALAASDGFDGLVLSDDSGLEVDAVGGEPGVRSARYAGEGASDQANREKLLQRLRASGAADRSARFCCVIAIARRGSILGTFVGAVEGRIVDGERGNGGFGYDSIFVPAGYDETFSELPTGIKNQISHRSRALAGAREFLERIAYP